MMPLDRFSIGALSRSRDVWLWVWADADSKLVPSWRLSIPDLKENPAFDLHQTNKLLLCTGLC